MKWKMLCYGMENKKSRYFWKRIPARMCIAFLKWESHRLEMRLEKKYIHLSSPKYSAEDIVSAAVKS